MQYSRLREQRVLLRGETAKLDFGEAVLDGLDEETFDDAYDEAPQEEREEVEMIRNALQLKEM